ncbi:MAG: cyclase family protein [Kiloniellales bacterium]
MSKAIDLTLPIGEHFRWSVERKLVGDMAKGDNFQITWLGMVVHAFTHIDSPRHMVPEGPTTSEVGLDKVIGEAAVVDLSGVAPETAITPEHLAAAGGHIASGDIVLLKTNWDRRESYQTPAYWIRAPYMTRAACEWLLERRIKAIGYDFPQDYPIRESLSGKKPPLSEFVTHDVLLRNGVIMIEYLCNLGAVKGPRTRLFALPLKIPDSDGAPARVIALEDDDLS